MADEQPASKGDMERVATSIEALVQQMGALGTSLNTSINTLVNLMTARARTNNNGNNMTQNRQGRRAESNFRGNFKGCNNKEIGAEFANLNKINLAVVNPSPISDQVHTHMTSSTTGITEAARASTTTAVPSIQKTREVDFTKHENLGHIKSSEFLACEVKYSTPLPTEVPSTVIPCSPKAPKVILEKLERLELIKYNEAAHVIFVEGDDKKRVRSCSNGVVRFVDLHDKAIVLEQNSWSSSLEEEENEKTSEAFGYGTFRRPIDGSRQNWVFDPGILDNIREFRSEALSLR